MTNVYGAFYYPPLENLPTFDVLVFRNAQNVTELAINSNNALITNTTSGLLYYPTFVDTSSGYVRIRTNAPAYTYNADTNTLSANTSGSSGTATTAANIALTSDDTSGTYFIPFSKTTSPTSNALYIDNVTTPLSYNPDTSTLTATNFSGNAITATTATTATQVTLSHAAIGVGSTNFLVMSATDLGSQPLLTDNAGIYSLTYESDTGTLNCVNFQGISSNAYLVRASDTNPMTATIYYLPFVDDTNAGYYDLNTTTNLSYDISTQTLSAANFNGLASSASLATQVTLSNTATGATNYLVMSATNSGSSSLLTDDAGATYDSTTNTAAINISGNAATATTATTASTASLATQVTLSNTATGATNYLVMSATNSGSSSLLTDTAGATYDSTTNIAAINISGNAATATTATTATTASLATQVTLSNTASGATNYLVMSATNTGSSSLLTDNAGATYDSTTNIAAINISGNAATATTATTSTNTNNININNITTGSRDYYVTFVDTASGYQILRTNDPDFIYQIGTNTLTVNISGNAATTTAVGITDTTTGTTYYPTFVDSSSGTPILRTYAADLGYDATNQRLKISGITPNNGRNINFNGTPIGNGGNINSVCMGVNAGPAGIIPNNNFCFGTNSGSNITVGGGGVQNLCIGPNSGNQLTTGSRNTFLGGSAGRFTTTGQYNTQIGAQSQGFPDNNLIGFKNTTIGGDCHILNDGLSYSTAIGAEVVASTSNTVRIGRSLDNSIFDGTVNVVGLATFNAGNIKISGGAGINVGQGSGSIGNLVIGASTPSTVVFTTGNNTLVGTSTGQSSGVGAANNTCVGSAAGQGITSSGNNTFVGCLAGFQTANGTGNNNTCVGFAAGDAMTTTATQNTLLGSDVAGALTTGTGNTVIGFGASTALLTGISNTIIGLQAGDNITGSFNTCIGSGSSVPTAGGSNQISIGTSTETMFIRGALNYRIGPTFTPTAINQTVDLSTSPIAQFYIVNIAFTGCVVQVEAPTNARCVGSIVTFKRKTGNVAYTINTGTAFNYFLGVGALAVSASIAVAAGVFQTSLISDGITWCEINRT